MQRSILLIGSGGPDDDPHGRAQRERQEWPVYGGDPGATRYSPLADINRGNVGNLQVAWTWKPAERALQEYGTQPGTFQNTPLMIDDVLYVSTPYNRVVALDARTGRELWRYDPEPFKDGQPPNGTGFVHRGVAAWRDEAGQLRIFINSRYRLICLDARTGAPVMTFGDAGHRRSDARGCRGRSIRGTTRTRRRRVVFRNLVILGNGVGDRLTYRNDPPGDVRAFDARTGKIVWTFRPIPRPGEFGNETWGEGSWQFTGHTNVWAPMSLDAARGLLYLPVSTPSNDYYGVRRPGANLFAESIVCLDAATGQRKWHFQIVHHGLWDYDLPAAPILDVDHGRRQSHRRRRAAHQAGVRVRVRSRHRQARVADRGARRAGRATCPASRRGRRSRFPPSRRRFTEQGVRSRTRSI